jgi:hypothetical protein
MIHNDDSNEIVRSGEGRNQWLAMQSAYAEYRRTSEALAASDQAVDDLPARRTLEAQQRDAFEQYLEARLAFLEFRFDESNRQRESPVDVPTRHRSAIASRFGNHGLLTLALVIGLVCAAAFSIFRAQRRVRDLEASRDALRAELSAARADIQRVANQMEGQKPAPASAVSEAQPAPSSQRVQPHDAPAMRPVAKLRSASTVRHRYLFSLARSHKFQRVGPIEVSLRSVDPKQNQISLSILSESARLDLQHIRLNQPVRIGGGDHGQRMELVIDHIDGGAVSGHLIEYQG